MQYSSVLSRKKEDQSTAFRQHAAPPLKQARWGGGAAKLYDGAAKLSDGAARSKRAVMLGTLPYLVIYSDIKVNDVAILDWAAIGNTVANHLVR